MAEEFAIVKDGVVVNRIVSDREFAEKEAERIGGEISTDPKALVGSEKKDGKFSRRKEKAKPGKKKPRNLELTDKEELKLIDFYESNGIISKARANEMKNL